MSENNKPVLANPTAAIVTSDFTEKDLALIEKYKEEGLPGIATVDNKSMARILDLYLSGKTYRQISQIVSINKNIILYLAHKFDWFQLRSDYLEDLETNIRSRVVESRLVNQDFLLQLMQMWQKKIGGKITRYLATDDEQYANAIDLKEIDKYLKTVETLHKLSADPKAMVAAASPIGLNVGEGMSITKNEEGGIDITPKNKAIGDMLKQMADSRREDEKKK